MAKANVKNKSTVALHPPYFQMISDAITSLKERTGSSQPAIAKFVEEKHGKVLPPIFRKLLSVQLKSLVKSEKLYKVKNSYKLSSPQSEKPKTAPKEKKVAEKTKRLSQVKTPEALKKKKAPSTKKFVAAAVSGGGKVKCLSQVKTPETMKKTSKLTPVKRKGTPKPSNANKKARK
ncbi:histone H1-like [Vigna unguiculata]|uniref:histone H1-like n=1 Tax=Vigna unguiculata TaxID=3917 RepID=UPI001015DBA0|nr:histone H1-like [Vigna unguiculata]